METALLQSIRAVDDAGAGRRGCVSWMPDDDEGRARAADRMRRHAPPTGAITRYQVDQQGRHRLVFSITFGPKEPHDCRFPRPMGGGGGLIK